MHINTYSIKSSRVVSVNGLSLFHEFSGSDVDWLIDLFIVRAGGTMKPFSGTKTSYAMFFWAFTYEVKEAGKNSVLSGMSLCLWWCCSILVTFIESKTRHEYSVVPRGLHPVNCFEEDRTRTCTSSLDGPGWESPDVLCDVLLFPSLWESAVFVWVETCCDIVANKFRGPLRQPTSAVKNWNLKPLNRSSPATRRLQTCWSPRDIPRYLKSIALHVGSNLRRSSWCPGSRYQTWFSSSFFFIECMQSIRLWHCIRTIKCLYHSVEISWCEETSISRKNLTSSALNV